MLPVVTRLLGIWIAAALLFLPAWAPATVDRGTPPQRYDEPAGGLLEEHIEGAERLEGRLLAPCCWDTSRQTLDIHGSPIALQLRREIRARLKHGEAPDAIEADLVARYGEKILAVPPGNPLRHVGTFLTVGLIAAGVGAALVLARWKRRAEGTESPPAPPGAGEKSRDEWDERLDEELGELGDDDEDA